MLNILDEILEAIIIIIEFIIVLTFHEWGHAKSANLLGDRTAELAGRLTLNPASHIDPIGTIILPLIGFIGRGAFFGWAKPVPVNPINFRNPKRDMMLVAVSGPLMNIITALVLIASLNLIIPLTKNLSSDTQDLIIFHVGRCALIAIFLAAFNMVPLHPLDGYSVLYGILPRRYANQIEPLERYGMAILMAVIFLPLVLHIPSPLLIVLWKITTVIYSLMTLVVRFGS